MPFKDGYLSLQINPKSEQPLFFEDDALKCNIEKNSITSTQKLSKELRSIKDIICR